MTAAASQFQVVEFARKKLRARVAITGPSGGGKTLSGLLLAHGLAPTGTIVVINTEPEGPQQYAGRPGVPDRARVKVIEFAPPHRPRIYSEALRYAVHTFAPAVILLDSLSHAWAGRGGVLEMVDQRKQAGTREFSPWVVPGAELNELVEMLITCPCHLVATMRSKMAYVQERDERTGKTNRRKVGLEPVQRDGMEYEFMLVLDTTTPSHLALASKDRTGIFDAREPFLIAPAHGAELATWLEGDAAARVTEAMASERAGRREDEQAAVGSPTPPTAAAPVVPPPPGPMAAALGADLPEMPAERAPPAASTAAQAATPPAPPAPTPPPRPAAPAFPDGSTPLAPAPAGARPDLEALKDRARRAGFSRMVALLKECSAVVGWQVGRLEQLSPAEAATCAGYFRDLAAEQAAEAAGAAGTGGAAR